MKQRGVHVGDVKKSKAGNEACLGLCWDVLTCKGICELEREGLKLGRARSRAKRPAMSWPCKRLLGLHYVHEERRNLGLQFVVVVGLS